MAIHMSSLLLTASPLPRYHLEVLCCHVAELDMGGALTGGAATAQVLLAKLKTLGFEHMVNEYITF